MAADGHLLFDTKLDEKGFSAGINKLGSIAAGGLKVLGGAVLAATGAFAGLTKVALDSVASLEQNIGGVETLFKESAQTVIDNANKAYKTAGMSANAYMQNVTSFSASLLQSVAGDTAKAAEIADMAMVDMSDNANKMGTDMASIQNAYQGFAKQNYTMLDNLKLGYGGTKEEMQRLLKDAEKFSGVKYDINNLKDVYSAIHVIQEELDITGTTAKEAGTTIEGSMSAAKAAFDNLMNGSGTATEFADTVITAAKNILKNVVEIVPRLAETLPEVGRMLWDELSDALGGKNAAVLIETGSQIVSNLTVGMIQALPIILEAAAGIVLQLYNMIITQMPQMTELGADIIQKVLIGLAGALPLLLTMGANILVSLMDGISKKLPTLIPLATSAILSFVKGILSNLPKLIQAGLNMLVSLAQGIANSLPTLIAEVPKIINEFCSQLDSFLPKILATGVKILVTLGKGILESIPTIIANAGEIVKAILNVITHFSLFNQGKQVITGLGNGIKSVFGSISSIAKNLIDLIKNPFKIDWGSIGKNIVTGIANGIKNGAKAIANAAKNAAKAALDAAKDFLGIHSPSTVFRDQVGKYMAQGMGIGFEKNIPSDEIEKSINDSVNNIRGNMLRVNRVDYTMAMASGRNNMISSRELTNQEVHAIGKAVADVVNEYMEEFKFVINEREFGRAVREV